MNEIEQYVRIGATKISIMDDAFNINMDRAKEICREIIKRKLSISWEMFSGMRADRVDQELAYLLKQAGCLSSVFGLEAGTDKVLKDIKKGVTLERIHFTLECMNKAGVGSIVNFIIGHPTETYEDAKESLRLAETLPCSYVVFRHLIPTKGTEAYRQLKQMELEGKAKFLFDYDYYTRNMPSTGFEPVFETIYFSAQQKRECIAKGKAIMVRRGLEYRLGKRLGRVVYWIIKNPQIFRVVNNLRGTDWGQRIYQQIRKEQ